MIYCLLLLVGSCLSVRCQFYLSYLVLKFSAGRRRLPCRAQVVQSVQGVWSLQGPWPADNSAGHLATTPTTPQFDKVVTHCDIMGSPCLTMCHNVSQLCQKHVNVQVCGSFGFNVSKTETLVWFHM